MNEFHLGEPVVYIKWKNEKDWLLYRNADLVSMDWMRSCFPMTAPFLYLENIRYIFIYYCDNCPHAIFEILFYILHEL